MEKIVKRVMKEKYIRVESDDFDEVTEYKTSDGRHYFSEWEAQKHEDSINLKRIKQFVYLAKEIGDTWYYAKNKDEIALLDRFFQNNNKVKGTGSNVEPNEWFTIQIDYNGDYPDVYTFITLQDYLDDVSSMVKYLEETN